MLSPEERQQLKAENPPVVDWLHGANAYFDWGWKGCGFGQLSFSIDKATGRITCMNECMSRESVREILHAFADFIADRAILLDNSDDVPPVDAEAERIKQIEEQQEFYRAQSEQRKSKLGQKFIPKSE